MCGHLKNVHNTVPQAGLLINNRNFVSQFWRLDAQDPGADRVSVCGGLRPGAFHEGTGPTPQGSILVTSYHAEFLILSRGEEDFNTQMLEGHTQTSVV